MTKYTDLMIDLETLGNTSNAAVVQIGAAAFNRNDGSVSEPFSVKVDAHSKSTMDQSTIVWWMGQSEEARKSVFEGERIHPAAGLCKLNKFIEDSFDEVIGYRIWSKPSTFDIVILENLYKNCDMQQPWVHWCTRDLRTLIEAAKLSRGEETLPRIAHDAGYDAEAQAVTAVTCFARLKKLDNGDT